MINGRIPNCVAMLLAAISCGQVFAQMPKYPIKPVRIIVPLAPGGPTDLNFRIIGEELSKVLKEQFIVDNRPGAGGTIGTEAAARAIADGHTLLGVSTTNMVISNQLYPVRYDMQRDFVPVALVTKALNLLVVHPSLPVRSISELVQLAKARPGQLFYSSSGSGTNVHLAMEMLKTATRVDIVHVPHKGGDTSVFSVLTGETQVAIQVLSRVVPLVEAGRLRAIAVTSDKRSRLLPLVPTAMEAGVKGYEASQWNGLLAPTGTPEPVVHNLSALIEKIMKDGAITEQMIRNGSEVSFLGSREFAAFAKAEYVRWGKAIKESGARVE